MTNSVLMRVSIYPHHPHPLKSVKRYIKKRDQIAHQKLIYFNNFIVMSLDGM